MKKSMLVFRYALLLMFCIGFSYPSDAAIVATENIAAHQWERLGSRTVDFRMDRDVIRVGARDGAFRKLKIGVTGGTMKVHKMVIEYRNGQKEVIEIRHLFAGKSASRIIDLKGNRRVIKDITFWYDSVNRRGRKATVHVFGKH